MHRSSCARSSIIWLVTGTRSRRDSMPQAADSPAVETLAEVAAVEEEAAAVTLAEEAEEVPAAEAGVGLATAEEQPLLVKTPSTMTVMASST